MLRHSQGWELERTREKQNSRIDLAFIWKKGRKEGGNPRGS